MTIDVRTPAERRPWSVPAPVPAPVPVPAPTPELGRQYRGSSWDLECETAPWRRDGGSEPPMRPTRIPVVVGYMNVPVTSVGPEADQLIRRWRRDMAITAKREAYRLSIVFCDEGGRERAFFAMVDALRSDDAVAVLVPDLTHLTGLSCFLGADVSAIARYLRAPLLLAEGPRHGRRVTLR